MDDEPSVEELMRRLYSSRLELEAEVEAEEEEFLRRQSVPSPPAAVGPLPGESSPWITSQKELLKSVKTLKRSLAKACRQTGIKLEQVRKLTEKVDQLQQEKVNKELIAGGKEVEDESPSTSIDSQSGMGTRPWRNGVFPEEVWRIIISKVSEPKDLWSLCNSWPLFDTILSEWKTGWLLAQALPYLYQHLPGNKLLECRLVCKSWMGAVDNFLDNHPSLLPHNPDKIDPRRLDFVNPMREKQIGGVGHIGFRSSSDWSILADPVFVQNWTQYRLIGRYITLKLGRYYLKDSDEIKEATRKNEDADPGFHQMWATFCAFLSSFGKEVQHMAISFTVNDMDGNVDAWEEKILQFLTTDLFPIFPNLRKLHIQKYIHDFRDGAIPAALLPPAPKLETLEFHPENEVGTTMLRRYNLQLAKLDLSVSAWKQVNMLEWPNLTELLLHFGAFVSEGDFNSLYGLRTPQLSKLGLDVSYIFEYEGGGPIFGRLLGIARELSSRTRLHTLRWGLKEAHKFSIAHLDSLCYATAQVKTLELELDLDWGAGWDSVCDFVLPCFPLVENLHLFAKAAHQGSFPFPNTEISLAPPSAYDYPPMDLCRKVLPNTSLWKGQGILEVAKFMLDGDMYRSNIWELLPLLKLFSFQWAVYTRIEYEAYRSRSKLSKK